MDSLGKRKGKTSSVEAETPRKKANARRKANSPAKPTRSQSGSPIPETKAEGLMPEPAADATIFQSEKVSIYSRNQSLFDAPKGSILVHACNAKGVWGKGIAKHFKDEYTEAYEDYQLHCKSPASQTLGTVVFTRSSSAASSGSSHSIASLIVKAKPGGTKNDSERNEVINYTKQAIEQLLRILIERENDEKPEETGAEIPDNKSNKGQEKQNAQHRLLGRKEDSQETSIGLCMPKINAGLFKVDWEQTVECLKNIVVPESCCVTIIVYLGSPSQPASGTP